MRYVGLIAAVAASLLIGSARADEADEFFHLAFQAQQDNDQQRALDLFLRGLRLHPDPVSDGKARYYLGKTYEALGQRQNALDSYRAAEHFAPDSVEAAKAVNARKQIEAGLQGRLQAAVAIPDLSGRLDAIRRLAVDFPEEIGPATARDDAAQRLREANRRLEELAATSDPNLRLQRLTLSDSADQTDRDALSLPEAEAMRTAARLAIAAIPRPAPAPRPAEPAPDAVRFAALMSATEGRWTTGRPTECPYRFYTWSHSGNQISFVDERGQTDEELVTGFGDGLLQTQTTSSRHTANSAEMQGTRWEYRFMSDGRVQVQNLSRGNSFILTRCP